ncbi:MAG: hypothetical protein VYB09_01060, partial [Planctomycetota bacterium]|nr:hypothetical protein [Planctomycetota bacterium]
MIRWPLDGRPLIRRATALLLAATAVLLAGELAAQTEVDSKLEAFLSAGEFGPARELAQNATSQLDHDRQLKRIARSQALSGARSASLQSLSEIRDDRVRSEALDEMLGAGGGA